MALSSAYAHSYGTDTPELDVPPTYWVAGDLRSNVDTATLTLGLIGWYCSVTGRPGTWVAIYGSTASVVIPRVANIAALAAIVTASFSAAAAHLAQVLSVDDFFVHRPTGGRGPYDNAVAYASGDFVFYATTGKGYRAIAAGTGNLPTNTAFWVIDMESVASATTGNTSLWTRMGIPSTPMQAQVIWSIHPTTGDDENAGYGVTQVAADAVPLRTVAEWRRRIHGADWTSRRTIKVLAASSNTDDGRFYGFNTTSEVVVWGARTVVGSSSTLTGYAGTSSPANDRWTVTDSALATSWTASYGMSSAASGSRWICKVGGGVQARLLQEPVAKTAQIGTPVDTSEDPNATLMVNATNFGGTDAYQVKTQLSWPALAQLEAKAVTRYLCLDVVAGATGAVAGLAQYTTCGFKVFYTGPSGPGAIHVHHAPLFMAGATVTGNWRLFFGDFIGTAGQIYQLSNGETDWNGSIHTLINSELDAWHRGDLANAGTLRFFDRTSGGNLVCLSVRYNSRVTLDFGAMQGLGNTQKLIYTERQGVVSGGGNVTAITSDTTPYGVGPAGYFATPGHVDGGSGCAIHSNTV